MSFETLAIATTQKGSEPRTNLLVNMDYTTYSYKQLQAECKRLGLSAGGKTAVLIARLEVRPTAAAAASAAHIAAVATTTARATTATNGTLRMARGRSFLDGGLATTQTQV